MTPNVLQLGDRRWLHSPYTNLRGWVTVEAFVSGLVKVRPVEGHGVHYMVRFGDLHHQPPAQEQAA